MTEQAVPLLLAEDEPTQRLLLARFLERSGYRVATAENGLDAFERISTGNYPILISDWDMPEMDGVALCRKVRESRLDGYVYILLLTGHGPAANVVEGLKAGADDYIRKPADQSELLARLSAGKRIIRLEQSLREANAQIALLSVTDGLTGSFNRRYFNPHFQAAVAHARRYSRPLSVLMADIDHFKNVNDQHGHVVGDEVIRRFADVLRASIRSSSDWCARYGGEEFAVVLPETPREGGLRVAEKIRCSFGELSFDAGGRSFNATASFGVGAFEPRADDGIPVTAESLIEEADAALYRSKRGGRNRVS